MLNGVRKIQESVFDLLPLFGANSQKYCCRSTVGQDTATFLISCGILSKAWEELRRANNLENFSLNEYEGVAYVSFPSFQEIEHFNVNGSKYGEGNIQTDNKVFSASLKGNDDQPALVHQGAVKLFLHILENTDFQAKVNKFNFQDKLILDS